MPKDFQGFTETPAVVGSEAAGGKKVASNADSSKKRYTGLEEFRHVERSEADRGARASKAPHSQPPASKYRGGD